MAEVPFEQELYNRLSTVFERTVGIALDIRQIDRLHDEAKKLGELITKQINKVSQEKALQVCRLLNEATLEGFKLVGEDISTLQERLKIIEGVARNAEMKADSAQQFHRPIGSSSWSDKPIGGTNLGGDD